MTKYKENVWYGWNGGECPVHIESVVQVSTCEGWYTERAGNWNWDDKKTPISSFRVVNEYREPREPREFWIVAATGDAWETEARAKIAADGLVDPTIIHVREVLE